MKTPSTRRPDYVFISYSSADSMFAKKIVAALESAGVGLWIDDQELKAGDSLLDRIQSAIDRANFFMILLSPNSVASRWVQEELKFAMTRQLKGIDRFVIPLVVEPCDIPPFLQDRVYVDFTNKRRFKSNAAKLLHAIDQASGDGSDVDSVNYPDKTILDKLAADSELAVLLQKFYVTTTCSRCVANINSTYSLIRSFCNRTPGSATTDENPTVILLVAVGQSLLSLLSD